MAHVVTQPCCNDASCVAVCPVDCIHPTPRERTHSPTEMLFIDPGTCIDCGACVDECPVDAIVPPEDLTLAMQPFVEMNAAYFAGPRATATSDDRGLPVVGAELGTLRVAIVGSGPSACYAADGLASVKGLDVAVTIIEKLPVPGGLVRHGVAPDHGATKGIGTVFARILGRKGCTVHLNTEVGVHITHEELLRYHHAVVYASGAEGDRPLGVTGEQMPGNVAARDFVLWYNGHPDHVDVDVDLSGERAVVVGNGNVALDVARILTGGITRLSGSDIAEHALEALASSRVREVVVLGRRGPEHAAFSTSELLGLGDLPGVAVTASHSFERTDTLDELTRIRASILDRYVAAEAMEGKRRIHLQFFRSPVEVTGSDRATGVRVAINERIGDGGVRDSGRRETIEADFVVRSVGFRGCPVPGLPFDVDRNVLPNLNGAVCSPDTGERLRGVYVAGWLKRGPSGVIGSNRVCSEETVAEIVADFGTGRLGVPTGEPEDFVRLVQERQPDRLDLTAWRRLDTHERKAGRSAGRSRVKTVARADMVAIALGRDATRG